MCLLSSFFVVFVGISLNKVFLYFKVFDNFSFGMICVFCLEE